jgi:hypothetical protein
MYSKITISKLKDRTICLMDLEENNYLREIFENEEILLTLTERRSENEIYFSTNIESSSDERPYIRLFQIDNGNCIGDLLSNT